MFEDPKKFQVILLTFPNMIDSNIRSQMADEEDQRVPLTGTIDEVGRDVKRINEIGTSHVIFGFNFSPVRADIDGIVEIMKQISKFAR